MKKIPATIGVAIAVVALVGLPGTASAKSTSVKTTIGQDAVSYEDWTASGGLKATAKVDCAAGLITAKVTEKVTFTKEDRSYQKYKGKGQVKKLAIDCPGDAIHLPVNVPMERKWRTAYNPAPATKGEQQCTATIYVAMNGGLVPQIDLTC